MGSARRTKKGRLSRGLARGGVPRGNGPGRARESGRVLGTADDKSSEEPVATSSAGDAQGGAGVEASGAGEARSESAVRTSGTRFSEDPEVFLHGHSVPAKVEIPASDDNDTQAVSRVSPGASDEAYVSHDVGSASESDTDAACATDADAVSSRDATAADDTLSHVTVSDADEGEPSFTIEAMGASVSDILTRDTIASVAVSLQHVALGMHSGRLYVVSRDGHLDKAFSFHTAPVLHVVFDTTGEFVASAGMDGLVMIASLTSSEQYRFDFQRPMRTVALEPHFGARSTRAFVCGGMSGVLVHREKRWFGHREVVVHSDEGPIWATAWRGPWLAWANDYGVRVADAATQELITRIPAPAGAARAELVRCSLQWRDDTTLVIAQGTCITLACVRTRATRPDDEVRAALPALPSLTGLAAGRAAEPRHYVEITDIFELDGLVAGVALQGDTLITLAYVLDEDVLQALSDERVVARAVAVAPPELRRVSLHGEELSSDELPVEVSESRRRAAGLGARVRCNDLHLCATVEPRFDAMRGEKTLQPVFFVASPTQLLVARPRGIHEHIEWLLARGAYRAALEALEALGSAPAAALGFDVKAIGHTYLTRLMDAGDYAGAARLFPLILRTDTAAWEHFVLLYLERGQLDVLLPFIPLQDPELSEFIYDMVLVHLLHTDEAALLATLRAWPSHLYSTQAVAAAIEDRANDSRVLLECLAQMYLATHQPGRALQYLLRLRHASVFGLIRDNNLYIDVAHRIAELVELDQDMAGTREPTESVLVPMLVDHIHAIPIQRAMPQLAAFPWYEYRYLDALFERDPPLIAPHANLLVARYATYDYAKLMPFLRAMSSVYSFSYAYRVCEEHEFVPEMVFLRGRTGDLRGALDLILERLGDVRMAIEFVQAQDDAELWENLLAHSQNNPPFIRGLLEHVGGEIDPVRIIRPIREGLVIPGLRPALIKTLRNFSLQHSLMQGGLSVLKHSANELLARLQDALTHAYAVDTHTSCCVCQTPLLGAHAQPLVVYMCTHAAHLGCVVPLTRSLAPYPALVLETTTQLAARARESWIGLGPSDTTGRASDVKVTGHTADRDAAQRRAMLRSRFVAPPACPTCAAGHVS